MNMVCRKDKQKVNKVLVHHPRYLKKQAPSLPATLQALTGRAAISSLLNGLTLFLRTQTLLLAGGGATELAQAVHPPAQL